jgi:3-hydroxy acid dehydrogenase/malonic semialdehyde reductase
VTVTELASETIFITGASSGFGAALARKCSKSGAKLILAARRTERLEALAAELGTPCHLVTLDVRDRAAVEGAVASLPEGFREVTTLVNNAGLALGMGPAQSADLADWDAMVDTNIKGTMYCTHALLPGMIARNRGYVMNLGSVAASYPYPGGHVYCGTKAFVHQFSLALRSDLLGTRVRVTVIEPGMAETEFSQVRFKGDDTKAKAIYAGAEALTAEDIADTIHWCLTRPPHVNVNTLELMTVRQAFSPFAVARS